MVLYGAHIDDVYKANSWCYAVEVDTSIDLPKKAALDTNISAAATLGRDSWAFEIGDTDACEVGDVPPSLSPAWTHSDVLKGSGFSFFILVLLYIGMKTLNAAMSYAKIKLNFAKVEEMQNEDEENAISNDQNQTTITRLLMRFDIVSNLVDRGFYFDNRYLKEGEKPRFGAKKKCSCPMPSLVG